MSTEYYSTDGEIFQHTFQKIHPHRLPADHLSNIALIADTPSCSCPKPRVYLDKKTKRRKQANCNRADCDNEECRKAYAQKHSSILQNEVKQCPIDFYSTLKFCKGSEVTEKAFKIGIRKIVEALRKMKSKKKWFKSNKSIKFQYTTDFTERGTDWNLLIWSTGFRTWRTLKKYLRPIIQRYFPGKKFRLYVQTPKSQVAVIKYSFKDLKDRSTVSMPHRDWIGKRKVGGCRMPSGRRKSDIWHEVLNEWFPNKKTSEVYTSTHLVAA